MKKHKKNKAVKNLRKQDHFQERSSKLNLSKTETKTRKEI